MTTSLTAPDRRPILPHLLVLTAVVLLPAATYAFPVIQDDFDTTSFQSNFTFTQFELGSPPAVTGGALRLSHLENNSNNVAAWDTRPIGVPSPVITLSFDFRLSPDQPGGQAADGFAVGLFDSTAHGTSGPWSSGAISEAPTFGSALTIGFDIFEDPDDLTQIRARGLSAEFLANLASPFNINTGVFHRAVITVADSGSDSLLSLTLIEDLAGAATSHAVLTGVTVTNLDLDTFSPRLAFGARTGGFVVETDIDNLSLTATSQAAITTGTAAQTTTLDSFTAALALDNIVNFTHTNNADNNPTWQVLIPQRQAFESVTVWNREASDGTLGCCPSRLRDITVEIIDFDGDVTSDFTGGTVVFSSALLNPENILGGGTRTAGPLNLTTDPELAIGNLIRVRRTPDPDFSGIGGSTPNPLDDRSVLSIDLVEAASFPAEVTVTTSSDAGPGSLRQTIADAIHGQRIIFDPSLSGTTIILDGTAISIDKQLEITASDLPAGITLDARGQSRTIEVASGADVTLRSLNITGGRTTTNQDRGGGILNAGALVLDGVTVHDNAAPFAAGGGISNSGTLTLTNSTVARNTAFSAGGIFQVGTAHLRHSTVASNAASGNAGGVRASGGTLVLEHSVIAANTAPSTPDLDHSTTFGGTLTLVGTNFVGSLDGNTLTESPIVLTGNPHLSPLGFFGGPTLTAHPLADSPLIDSANTSTLLTDQRAFPRPVASTPDLGAVEAAPAVTVTSTEPSGPGSLRDALANPSPLGRHILFDPAVFDGSPAATINAGDFGINSGVAFVDASNIPGGVAMNPGSDFEALRIGGSSSTNLSLANLHVDTALTGFVIVDDARTTVISSSFSNCSGLGILNFGNSRIYTSTLNDNSGFFGGAVDSSGVGFFSRCTFTGNTSQKDGGAIRSQGPLTVESCTITANHAVETGGGGIGLPLSSRFVLIDSIVAANTVGTPGTQPDIKANNVTGGGNLIGDNTGVASLFPAGLPNANRDHVGSPGTALIDPLLGPLAHYGGPTETMLPLPGSPAIDPPTPRTFSPLASDQRGFPRSIGNSADIGALETGFLLVNSTADSIDLGSMSLRRAVSLAHNSTTIGFTGDADGGTISLASSIPVTRSLFIGTGLGSSGVTVSTTGQFRTFEVDNPDSIAAISGLTVSGGGISIAPLGSLALTHCTLIDNTSPGDGGAVENQGALVVQNCTFTRNHAAGSGGAIHSTDGLFLTQSTIVGNFAEASGGGLSQPDAANAMVRTIVSGNSAPSSPDLDGLPSTDTDNFVGGTPQLSSLGFFGGSTLTFHPLAGSPLIDASVPFEAGDQTTDQRGFPRTGGGPLDIGAIEVGPVFIVDSKIDGDDGTSLRTALASVTEPGTHIRFDPTVFAVATAPSATPLRVDFNSNQDAGGSSLGASPANSPAAHNQPGFQSYHADHEVAAEFTPETYDGITITPDWPNTTDPRVRQSIDRGAVNDNNWDNAAGDLDLVTDFIGIDSRTINGGNGNWDGTTGTPTFMTLTIDGLAPGTYDWTSFHHDTENAHGHFSVEISTDGGTSFVSLPDGYVSDSTPAGNPDSSLDGFPGPVTDPFAHSLASTYHTTFTATGEPVVFRWAPFSNTAVHRQIWALNGFVLEPSTPEIALLHGTLEAPAFPTFIDASNLPTTITVAAPSALPTRVLAIAEDRTLATHGISLAGGQSATGAGAHIAAGAQLSFTSGSVASNTATSQGGGIMNLGKLRVDAATIADNSANDGAGIATGGPLEIVNTTFSQNIAANRGGAIFVNASSGAGTLHAEHITVTENSAGTAGGGIRTTGDAFASLRNSLLTSNLDAGSPSDFSGSFTALGNNLVTAHTTGTLTNPSNVFSAPGPHTAPLADNGGLTPTARLLASSPAIDAAVPSRFPPPTDQTGAPRILGTAPDLGALESVTSDLSPDGLTLLGFVPNAAAAGDVVFEISTDPEFRAVTTTFAGTGTSASLDGPRLDANLSYPAGIDTAPDGTIYFADSNNNQIRRIATDGTLTTIAGTGAFGFADGSGPTAKFASPTDVAVDANGDVFVTDTFNHRIRKLTKPFVNGGTWTVTTVAGRTIAGNADGPPGTARFNSPHGIGVGPDGDLFVADRGNNSIRRITPSGSVTTFASSGFDSPFAVDVDPVGVVIVADSGNNAIRLVDTDGDIIFLSGFASQFPTGTGLPDQFNSPAGLVFAGPGRLFLADEGNHLIRQIDNDGNVTEIAGDGTPGFREGSAQEARFHCPIGVALLPDGNLVVSDSLNHRIRHIRLVPIEVAATKDVVLPNGTTVSADVDFDDLGLDPGTYFFRTRAADGTHQQPPSSFTIDAPVTVVTETASDLTPTSATLNATITPNTPSATAHFEYSTEPDLSPPLHISTLADPPGFREITSVVFDSLGNLFVADRDAHTIFKVTPDGTVSDFAGDGQPGFVDGNGQSARFEHPTALAIDENDNLFVADEFNHVVRKITSARDVTTFAGSGTAGFADAPATDARFLFPAGIAVNRAGTEVYVADTGNHRIRLVAAGSVSTLAGSGAAGFDDGSPATASFRSPRGLAVFEFGGTTLSLLVTDSGNHAIRVLSLSPAEVTTGTGTGTPGFADGDASLAQFSSPSAVAILPNFHTLIADTGNHRIRSTGDTVDILTLAGSGIPGEVDSPTDKLFPPHAVSFDSPSSIAVSPDGQTIAVTDLGSGRLRLITRGSPRTVAVPGTISGNSPLPVAAAIPEPLFPGTTYFYRAVGTNSRGPVNGEILSFTTPRPAIRVHNGTSADAPVLTHSQIDPLDFGSFPVDEPQETPLLIANPGSFDLTVTAIDLPPGYATFSLSLPLTVPAGGSSGFFLTLERSSPGTSAGTVTISSDDLDTPEFQFPVTGRAVAAPVLTNLAATSVEDLSAVLGVTVNPGDSPTTLTFEFSKNPDLTGAFEVVSLAGLDQGFANGCGPDAAFHTPTALAVDSFGNLYLADTDNHRIRKVTPDGEASVFAGSGTPGFANGTGPQARFNAPRGIAIDSLNNLYISDTNNHRIRKITPDRNVTTLTGTGQRGFTDGVPVAARFNAPLGIVADPSGNLFVADSQNHRVRKIAPDGTVSTAVGLSAALDNPTGVTLDSSGNLFVSDTLNHRVLRLTPGGNLSVFVPPGTLATPTGLAADGEGGIFIADTGNHVIRRVSSTGSLTLFAGTGDRGILDGNAPDAEFAIPAGLARNTTGTLYVADTGNNRIRRIAPTGRSITIDQFFTGPDDIDTTTDALGLEEETEYFFRATATNAGGTTTTGTLTFTTEVSDPILFGLSANGTPIEGFEPCVFAYSLLVPASSEFVVFSADASSPDTAISIFQDGNFCCAVDSGQDSPQLPVSHGDNHFAIQLTDAPTGNTRTYHITVTRIDGTHFTPWAENNFGPDASDPLIAGESADPDLDGIDNLFEYGLRLDPNKPSTEGLPETTPAGPVILFVYNQNAEANDITYTVYWSDDALTWNTAGVTQRVLSEDGLIRRVEASIPAGTSPHRFTRLGISRP